MWSGKKGEQANKVMPHAFTGGKRGKKSFYFALQKGAIKMLSVPLLQPLYEQFSNTHIPRKRRGETFTKIHTNSGHFRSSKESIQAEIGTTTTSACISKFILFGHKGVEVSNLRQ